MKTDRTGKDPGGCGLMKCTSFKDGVCDYPGDLCKFMEQVDSELAALEADNAAMREKTLNELDRLIGEAFENPHTVSTIGSSVAAIGLKIARAVVHRALTPDSGKVLVDLDMLRKIDFALAACPVCQAGRDKAPGGIWEHSSDCEFSALLKDRP